MSHTTDVVKETTTSCTKARPAQYIYAKALCFELATKQLSSSCYPQIRQAVTRSVWRLQRHPPWLAPISGSCGSLLIRLAQPELVTDSFGSALKALMGWFNESLRILDIKIQSQRLDGDPSTVQADAFDALEHLNESSTQYKIDAIESNEAFA